MVEMDSEGPGGGGTAPVTKGEVLTVGAALGAGYGAHVAIEAGAAVGGAAIPIYGAAASGLAASAVVGWQIGTLIKELPVVDQFLKWMTDVYVSGTGLPTGPLDPLREWITPPTYPDLNYSFNYGPSATPQDVWWYVPQDGDLLADNQLLFSDPIQALELIGVGGGAGLYLLIADINAV